MRSFVVRFYTKHDIDLLPLYYRNVNVPDTIHQVLVAFGGRRGTDPLPS